MTMLRPPPIDAAELLRLERALAVTQRQAERLGLPLVSSLIGMAILDLKAQARDIDEPRHLDS